MNPIKKFFQLSPNAWVIILFWASMVLGTVLAVKVISYNTQPIVPRYFLVQKGCSSELQNLGGKENAYACIDKQGKLFRSDIPCK